MRSMALRSRQSAGKKHGFQRLFVLGGMLGVTPAASPRRHEACGQREARPMASRRRVVRHLTAGQQEGHRPALTVRERVDPGRSSAMRAEYGRSRYIAPLGSSTALETTIGAVLRSIVHPAVASRGAR